MTLRNVDFLACGVAPGTRDFVTGQIVGGAPVSPYSLPWQVGLVNNNGNRPFCGGTLISSRHILTASHCIRSNPTSNTFDIIVGEHGTTNSSDGTRHEICRAVRHPTYNNGASLDNDFAIVHLKQPVQLYVRAVPACLPTVVHGNEFLAGKNMTVSGWGRLSSGGGIPTVLHSVVVPGITNPACKARYGNSRITTQMLCAGDVANGGIDSCQGDSGGKTYFSRL